MTKPRGTIARALFCAWAATLPLLPVAAAAQQGEPAARRIESPEISRDSVVRLARAQLGRRYLFGGTTPAGFDCSGFLKYLMRAMGVELPRTAAQQAQAGVEIPRDPRLLRPGDILTFGRGNRVTHVGMYIGDGKYIHASSGAGRIVESRLDRPQSHLVRAGYGVRRFLSDSTTSVAQRGDTTRTR